MYITEQYLESLIKETVKATLLELGIDKQNVKEDRNAFQKTELLLWNYKGFRRVIKDKETEILELRKYGVPHRGSAVHTYNGSNNIVTMSTSEETIEAAVSNIQKSILEISQVVRMLDSAMKSMEEDPYYNILEMRYFNGASMEDISKVFKCTQPNITYHKNRLVRELSLRLFPNEVAKELLQ